MASSETIALDNVLDLGKLLTTGSYINLNDIYCEENIETLKEEKNAHEPFGHPVESFQELQNEMCNVDPNGMVKKKILNEGGGEELTDQFTVSFVFSGYWEKEKQPFVTVDHNKPMRVNFKDNGLLPGLLTAIKSMLVGETSVFLLSYKVMYGELGVPPKIKPKSDSIFYIKLVKAILTPKESELDLSEPNIFNRVFNEGRSMLSTAAWLSKTKNYSAGISLLRKAINMLHKTRLANEEEERLQVKLLIKLYINLAISYNASKLPLKACVACNELNRLTNIWNNSKILFQNAKALRMIGAFDDAEKKLRRAMNLSPGQKELEIEYKTLTKIRESYIATGNLLSAHMQPSEHTISEGFKKEIDDLIKKFKTDINICKLTLPSGLNSLEVEYVNTVCKKNKLFCNKTESVYRLDKDNINTNNIELDTEDYTDGFN